MRQSFSGFCGNELLLRRMVRDLMLRKCFFLREEQEQNMNGAVSVLNDVLGFTFVVSGVNIMKWW